MISFSKVWVFCFCYPPFSDVLTDICGTLRGGSIVKESLKGTYCGSCKRLPVSTVPGAPGNRRGLLPIITDGSPWMHWECLIDCHSKHSSVNFGFCICTVRAEPDSLVHCDVITLAYLTMFANIDLGPTSGPLATNV